MTKPPRERLPKGHAMIGGIVAGTLSGLLCYFLLGTIGLIVGLFIGALVGYRTAMVVSSRRGEPTQATNG